MKHLSTLFIAAALLVGLTGCLREDSENVNQDRIWAHYELFYDGNEDITYARTTFRFGNGLGTKLELTEPSTVSFDGVQMPFRPALGYYETSLAGFVDNGTFVFTDMDGNSFVNDATIRAIEHPMNVPTLVHGQSVAYGWQGDAVASGETVTLIITGGNSGGTQTFTTSAIGATQLVLPMNQVNQLSTGTGDALIERTFAPEVQQATSAGGLIWGRYRAVNVPVTIE